MSDGGVKQLVVDCLGEAERFTQALLERACEANPSVADELRRRYGALRAAGLVPDGGSFGTEPDPWSEGARRALTDPEVEKSLDAVGPYRRLRELGRGGQAVVYLAEDTRLHRPVALKVLRGLGPLTETMMRRFRREAEIASRLDHPGICAVFDAGVAEGVPYIAMRFVEGTTLADRIATAKEQRGVDDASRSVGSRTKAGIHAVLEIVEKAARALHVAHEAGIVHRDVKPGNIMITPRGETVLLDFGLAGDEDGDFTSLTGTGESLGTPAYMSPEQLMARRIRVDRRTDVYSLGVTLFECLTLERPFRGGTRDAIYHAIQHEAPTDVQKLNPGLPRDLRILIETALEKDRDRRYQSAEALADDLARVRRGEPIAARRVSAPERAWRWARRKPVRATLLAALAVGIPVLTALIAHVVASQPAILEARRIALREQIDGHLEAGFDELDARDPGTARASFDAALALEPDSVLALSGKALALLYGRDAEGCLRFVDRDGATVKEDRVLRAAKACALRSLGREGAAADLEATAQGPVTGALGHFLVGLTLLPGGLERHRGPAADDRAAHRHFMAAALTSESARMIYHLRLVQAATHLGEDHAVRIAARSALTLWPHSARVNRRAAETLAAIDPATALSAARTAHGLDSTGADVGWLSSREELAVTVLRELLARGEGARDADSWYRIMVTIETLAAGFEEDLARSGREVAIRDRLRSLGEAPFLAIRNPDACPGLAEEHHERWRRAWTAIDAIAAKLLPR